MKKISLTCFVQGRALQFDQWRIVHLAEFGIVNFSEVSPSSFSKKSQSSDSSPKATKRRKAREEAEECPEVKQDLGQAEDREVEDADQLDGSDAGEVEPDPAELPTFVCSTCGEDFLSQMSLNLHRNSCVPEDFYDEFPADIIESGDLPFRKSSKSKGNMNVSSAELPPVVEDEAVNTDPSPLPSTATSSTCPTGLSSANEVNVEDNSEKETQHSGNIFNGGDERQERVESGERETKGELSDSVLEEGNLNIGDAESEAELHCCPAEIDRSGGEGLAKTDTTQIYNEHCSPETSQEGRKESSNSLHEESFTKLQTKSEEKLVTIPADPGHNEEMPQSFAFKQGELISFSLVVFLQFRRFVKTQLKTLTSYYFGQLKL